MAARKLQQEIEKCFKQVEIGVELFDAQYEKYEQANNAPQREKQVDTLKKECKKLQRLRDQIKTWAAGSDVKDKGPLQEKRELIESKMEKFKAVEKEMKTKQFSKEGLLLSSKADPKEREREEMRDFLADMLSSLGQQVEEIEAETGQIQVQAKKKKDNGRAERLGELEERATRHKFHQDRLELLMRALDNDSVDIDKVKSLEDDIRNYVENNQEVDFYEDEDMYNDFNLDEESETYGIGADHNSSQENHSVQDEPAESVLPADPGKGRTKSDNLGATRRPSIQIKSPLPALATLHNLPVPVAATVASSISNMRPAPPPTKPPGEVLKYASAAAAGAANDVAGIGIAPLPAPTGKPLVQAVSAEPTVPTPLQASASNSPAITSSQPAAPLAVDRKQIVQQQAVPVSRSPAPSLGRPSPASSVAQLAQASAREPIPPVPVSNGSSAKDTPRQTPLREAVQSQDHDRTAAFVPEPMEAAEAVPQKTNGTHEIADQDAESVYHLPASLQDLVDCYEEAKKSALPTSAPDHLRMLDESYLRRPEAQDTERPRYYKPAQPAAYTPSHYPQDPHLVFDNPLLYSRLDPDALFYAFYYRQGTYQQYLAAKELKNNSWRFHKQYQTWFQRHEEPKDITEDYERGTYRFFDYESSWLNRRKQDFEFRYKFLEDEL